MTSAAVIGGTDLSTPDLIRGLAGASGKRARLFPVPVSVLRAGARLADRAGALLGRSLPFDSYSVEHLTGTLIFDGSPFSNGVFLESAGESEPGTAIHQSRRAVRITLAAGLSIAAFIVSAAVTSVTVFGQTPDLGALHRPGGSAERLQRKARTKWPCSTPFGPVSRVDKVQWWRRRRIDIAELGR